LKASFIPTSKQKKMIKRKNNMAVLTKAQTDEVGSLLKRQIRRKLQDYNPETNNMPFHTRLLGKDRMALFSFVQSINTTLGTSVFEEVGEILAKPHFKHAEAQYKDFVTL